MMLHHRAMLVHVILLRFLWWLFIEPLIKGLRAFYRTPLGYRMLGPIVRPYVATFYAPASGAILSTIAGVVGWYSMTQTWFLAATNTTITYSGWQTAHQLGGGLFLGVIVTGISGTICTIVSGAAWVRRAWGLILLLAAMGGIGIILWSPSTITPAPTFAAGCLWALLACGLAMVGSLKMLLVEHAKPDD